MLWRERFDAVEDENRLEIQRLFGPERAVVVEDGDAFGGRNEVRRAVLRHLLDEGEDGFLRCGVIPRRQRICRAGDDDAREREEKCEQFHGCARDVLG